jgi:hypothetical protein
MRGTGECKDMVRYLQLLTTFVWCSPYSRQQAAYPLPWLRERKFWPTVSRVDDGELAIDAIQGCHAYNLLMYQLTAIQTSLRVFHTLVL